MRFKDTETERTKINARKEIIKIRQHTSQETNRGRRRRENELRSLDIAAEVHCHHSEVVAHPRLRRRYSLRGGVGDRQARRRFVDDDRCIGSRMTLTVELERSTQSSNRSRPYRLENKYLSSRIRGKLRKGICRRINEIHSNAQSQIHDYITSGKEEHIHVHYISSQSFTHTS